jgi:hypothetical protein
MRQQAYASASLCVSKLMRQQAYASASLCVSNGLLGGDEEEECDECCDHCEHRELEALPVLVLLRELVGLICPRLVGGDACSLLWVLACPDSVAAIDRLQVTVVQVAQDIPDDEDKEALDDRGACEAQNQVGDDARRPGACVVARRDVGGHVLADTVGVAMASHHRGHDEDEGGEEEVGSGIVGKGCRHHHHECRQHRDHC